MREINEDRVIREDECRKLTGVCRTVPHYTLRTGEKRALSVTS